MRFKNGKEEEERIRKLFLKKMKVEVFSKEKQKKKEEKYFGGSCETSAPAFLQSEASGIKSKEERERERRGSALVNGRVDQFKFKAI